MAMVFTGAVAAGVVIGWHLALMLRAGHTWRAMTYAAGFLTGMSLVAWWAVSLRAAVAVAAGAIGGALISVAVRHLVGAARGIAVGSTRVK